jgi:hypothetical protein
VLFVSSDSERCPDRGFLEMHHPAADSCSTPALTRALFAVELVREDPAAGIHNAAFVRQLLAGAARAL